MIDRNRRRLIAFGLLTCAACTRGSTTVQPTPTPTESPSEALPATVAVVGRTYDVFCMPVAEALVDVELPREAGAPKTRAIAGVWDHQAIAVLANDLSGCGVWALGMAEGLSPEASQQIQAEVGRGVQAFGVTASPVPREP